MKNDDCENSLLKYLLHFECCNFSDKPKFSKVTAILFVAMETEGPTEKFLLSKTNYTMA